MSTIDSLLAFERSESQSESDMVARWVGGLGWVRCRVLFDSDFRLLKPTSKRQSASG